MKKMTIILTTMMIAGCSVASGSKAETAVYKVVQSIEADQTIEVREYDTMVLATTSMTTDANGERNNAFRKLFAYISGENIDSSKIKMTTPVLMDSKAEDAVEVEVEVEGKEIPMTTPVFMDTGDEAKMSFVLPAQYTIDTAPVPKNEDVKLEELKDYKVAAIIFSGRLTDKNTAKHKAILEAWIFEQGLKIVGDYKTAAYNAPFVLPMFRRNEVIIPVK